MGYPRRALLSVSDKEGLVEFARGLRDLGFDLIATEGTVRLLGGAGVSATSVSDYTGVPEVLGGRVKTLHPKIFAGILAPRGDEPDLAEMGAGPVELVAANLYPFEAVVAKPRVDPAEAIENIDIGGVTLIRAAAKNAHRVAVVVRPSRYRQVLDALEAAGTVPPELRDELAMEAFEYTSGYDAAIYNYLWKKAGRALPPALRLAYTRAADLRYGENPYQKAAFYRDPAAPVPSIARLETLHGKELSYNNLVDLEAALRVASEFSEPAGVVIKHTNPSGVAVRADLAEAYTAAHAADVKAAYGCVVGLNRTVDRATVRAMKGHFVEAIVAPDFAPDALEALRKRKNLRLVRTGAPFRPQEELEMTKVSGGMLVQSPTYPEFRADMFRVVTKKAPTAGQIDDMIFGMRVSKFVKSNSIVLVKDRTTVGMGAGQMSRVDSVMLARVKAGDRARGSVLVSDAFFPFRDGVDEAARGGVSAIAQPGGSIRDAEVIEACDEQGIAMAFNKVRLFRH